MRRALLVLMALVLAACAPTVQRAEIPGPGFAGPRFEGDVFIAHDGARLGLSVWLPPEGTPVRAVVVGLHGINDYARTFEGAGPWWAARGIATYAYDARGHGRSPRRGVWGGEALMLRDAWTALRVARAAHPGVPVVAVGESMGAATIMAAAGARNEPPLPADRLVLVAPAVWGWSNLPLAYRTTLWLGAHGLGRRPVTAPRAVTRRIRASDNEPMLRALGRDPLMQFETRIDVIYGLVRLMERAYDAAGRLPPPTLLLYGEKDQIVPRPAVARTVARLPAHVRTVSYPDGWHMLLRDRQAPAVWADIDAFITDAGASLPSGTGPVSTSSRR